MCAFRPPLFGPNKPAETEAAETNKINEKKDHKKTKKMKKHINPIPIKLKGNNDELCRREEE